MSALGEVLEDASTQPPKHGGRPCELKQFLDSQPAEDAERFREVLYRRRGEPGRYFSEGELADILGRAGHPVHPSTISKHRNRRCISCRRS
jgi:hypothetical protein